MRSADLLLTAQHLSLSRRDRQLFVDLSFEIDKGQLWHLRGDNGSGKSSLLDLLVGLNSADEGVVRWFADNKEANEAHPLKPLEATARGLFHYCRQQNAVNPRLTIRENLQRQALWAKVKLAESAIEAWADEVALLALLDEPAGLLSQGQQKQIALARLRLFGWRSLWLLDEPFNSLDRVAVERLEQWIGEQVAAQGAVIMVSHTEQFQGLAVRSLHLSGAISLGFGSE